MDGLVWPSRWDPFLPADLLLRGWMSGFWHWSELCRRSVSENSNTTLMRSSLLFFTKQRHCRITVGTHMSMDLVIIIYLPGFLNGRMFSPRWYKVQLSFFIYVRPTTLMTKCKFLCFQYWKRVDAMLAEALLREAVPIRRMNKITVNFNSVVYELHCRFMGASTFHVDLVHQLSSFFRWAMSVCLCVKCQVSSVKVPMYHRLMHHIHQPILDCAEYLLIFNIVSCQPIQWNIRV